MTGVLTQRGNLHTETHTYRENNVKKGLGGRQPSTSQGKRPETDFYGSQKESTPPWGFQISSLKAVRQYIPVVLSYLVCGTLLEFP